MEKGGGLGCEGEEGTAEAVALEVEQDVAEERDKLRADGGEVRRVGPDESMYASFTPSFGQALAFHLTKRSWKGVLHVAGAA